MRNSKHLLQAVLAIVLMPCSILLGQIELAVDTTTVTAGNEVSLSVNISSLDGPVLLTGYNIPIDIGNDGFGIGGGIVVDDVTGSIPEFENFSFAETTNGIFNYDIVASDSDPDGIIVDATPVELLSITMELDKKLPGQTLEVVVVAEPTPNQAAFSMTIDGETSNAVDNIVDGAAEIRLLIPGDVNLDGSVDLLDVNPFVQLLQIGEFQIEADINCDYHINLLDVAPFIDLLSGG